MKYIDSNVFIFPVVADEKTEKKAALAKKILIKIAEGNLRAATSCLTWDEVTWAVRKFLGRSTSIIEGKKFLEFPNLKILDVKESMLMHAQKIVENHDIKPRDSMHLACALENEIREIISDDPDFDKIKEIKRISLENA